MRMLDVGAAGVAIIVARST